MTKCVATAVTRNSENVRTSGDTISSTSDSSDLREEFSTIALFPSGASLRFLPRGLVRCPFVECWQAIELEDMVRKSIGEKKRPCKNCEGKGTLKKGDKIVRCQRCGGTGIKPS